MATIKEKAGKGLAKGSVVSTSEVSAQTRAELDQRLAGIDFAALYDEADSQRVTKVKHETASAEQIRYVRDKLFDNGKTEIAIANLRDVVDQAYGLKKDEETGTDNRVQNSSVRSACEAEGKFEIINRGGAAILVRKAVVAKTA